MEVGDVAIVPTKIWWPFRILLKFLGNQPVSLGIGFNKKRDRIDICAFRNEHLFHIMSYRPDEIRHIAKSLISAADQVEMWGKK